ncbi:succinate dehydrogenase assembly factor 3, mitochondrial [Brienomyrus brachyistius]|uniref:succinate dehydrogenase assembly factor 3, mitochondrial n=1 Tax=Brienomyrus brachyistius TaxID=42636 RepID=UPI0020B1D1FE|nr:succinate dehydrogenase assembly factor 3, mitochondrial [Brienomyrus brachyistius]
MAGPSHVLKVRSLYKRILLLHRFMPLDLRALGDQYVKDEFRRHKAATPQEVTCFMREWENYKDGLQSQVLGSARTGQTVSKYGADLSAEQLSQLQDEQIGQLYELMLESTKSNRQFSFQEDSLKK